MHTLIVYGIYIRNNDCIVNVIFIVHSIWIFVSLSDFTYLREFPRNFQQSVRWFHKALRLELTGLFKRKFLHRFVLLHIYDNYNLDIYIHMLVRNGTDTFN